MRRRKRLPHQERRRLRSTTAGKPFETGEDLWFFGSQNICVIFQVVFLGCHVAVLKIVRVITQDFVAVTNIKEPEIEGSLQNSF